MVLLYECKIKSIFLAAECHYHVEKKKNQTISFKIMIAPVKFMKLSLSFSSIKKKYQKSPLKIFAV